MGRYSRSNLPRYDDDLTSAGKFDYENGCLTSTSPTAGQGQQHVQFQPQYNNEMMEVNAEDEEARYQDWVANRKSVITFAPDEEGKDVEEDDEEKAVRKKYCLFNIFFLISIKVL